MLDTSNEFWKQSNVCKPELYEEIGLYGIEYINNPNTITVSINPKEYLEKFKNKILNKRHKGLIKDVREMDFESYANRILSLNEI